MNNGLLKEQKGIGVIIARMQVPYLTESHKATINTVIQRHKRIIVFLGINDDGITLKNPYPFEFRRQMIKSFFPDDSITILPLPDKKDDNAGWVSTLDTFINSILVKGEEAVLYGGRDSFIPFYEKEKGKFHCVELAPSDYDSGTDLRELVAVDIPKYSFETAQAILWTVKHI